MSIIPKQSNEKQRDIVEGLKIKIATA